MPHIRVFRGGEIVEPKKPYEWDVVIGGIPYYVARWEDHVHTIGPSSKVCSLWAWPRSENPSCDNLVAYNGIPGPSWDIHIEEKNGLCFKHGPYCNMRYSFTINRNEERFYRQSYGNREFGYADVLVKLTQIQEHPLGFSEIDYASKINGRQVWYRSQPAVIQQWLGGDDCRMIIAPEEGTAFTVPEEFAEEESRNDYYEDEVVITTIFDDHVWWFREDWVQER